MRSSALRLGLSALVWAAAAFTAYGAFQFADRAWKRQSDGAAAFALHPDDAAALANHLETVLKTDPTYRPSRDDLAHARAGLVRAPLSPTSLWVIGLSSQASLDIARADAAMELANAISRRNPAIQLWLIERSVEKNDVAAAISHYNAALAVEPNLGQALFPILSRALAYPEVRADLTPYLAGESRWMPGFMAYAAAHARIEDFLAFVTPLAGNLQSTDYASANRAAIGRIALERDGWAALDYAARLVPGFDRKAFASSGFSPVTTDERLGSLAWSLTQGGGIDATLGQNGALVVMLESGAAGIVAARDLPVRPGGAYRFSQQIADTGDAEGQNLQWQAQCRSGKAAMTIGHYAVPWPEGSSTFQTEITVPDNCTLLRLSLTAEGPETQLPAKFEISRLTLRQL